MKLISLLYLSCEQVCTAQATGRGLARPQNFAPRCRWDTRSFNFHADWLGRHHSSDRHWGAHLQHLRASSAQMLRVYRRGGQVLWSRHLYCQFEQVCDPTDGHARPRASRSAKAIQRALHLLQWADCEGYAARWTQDGRHYNYWQFAQ